MNNEPIILDTPEQIEMFHLIQLKHALNLQRKGLKLSRGSALAYVKRHFGFRGNLESVYTQFCEYVEKRKGEQ